MNNYAVVGIGIAQYTMTLGEAIKAAHDHAKGCRKQGGYSNANIYAAHDVLDCNGSPYIPNGDNPAPIMTAGMIEESLRG